MTSKFTADFETTTQEDDVRVWAYGICEIGNSPNFTYGNNIDAFMRYCRNSNNADFYFHNLAFDGAFIITWLFLNGFTHVTEKTELKSKTFTTLISKMGMFYSMKIVFEKRGNKSKHVTIYDSLKILPFSVDAIAKGFNLPVQKQHIDYDKIRPVGYDPDVEEVKYLKADCTIVAMALDTLFKQGLDRMTQGSNALFDYQRTITQKRFNQWFPVPAYDADIRYSYKGGWTYLNPKFKGIDVGCGIVLDVNSLYPYVMRNKMLPYGEGICFEGKYVPDTLYNLHVQMFTCQFDLKEGHVPTIQVKSDPKNWTPTEYITTTGDKFVTLCLTSVDLELLYEHYDVYNEEWHSGWKFKSSDKMFVEYIDKWSAIKIQSKEQDNFAMYMLAKLMLNALYGKFGTSTNAQGKIPYMKDGVVRFEDGAKDTKKPIYIPVATFVTAWARSITIRSAQKCYDRFMYADTDSLHLEGTEIPPDLEIDDTKLGAWKHEATFKRARYVRQKTYFETVIVSDKAFKKMDEESQAKCFYMDGVRVKDSITCSGMPNTCYKYVTWENFHEGSSYEGKLQAKHVKGGILLKDTTFRIQAS